ncbi:MAG: sigma-54-dependent transcriptional regulator [Actinomycetota bacterium]
MGSTMQAVPQQEYSASGLSLLIVDDDNWMKEACKAVAEKLGFTVRSADSAVTALMQMATRPADVVLLDLRQTQAEAVRLLTRIKKLQPRSEVVVIGAQNRSESLSDLQKSGAFDFLHKPFTTNEFRALLERMAVRLRERNFAAMHLNRNGSALISQSVEIQKLTRMIPRVASSRQPLLIVGESGTGRESLAHCVHAASEERSGSFVRIDCTSRSQSLIEVELFGTERPAGTTLFLDEVSELPLDLQGKLVRALQDRQIRWTGTSIPVPFESRIIASTRMDLEPASRLGGFRRDLYQRLNVVSLRLPPLRERKEDIHLLVRHVLARISAERGRTYNMSEEAMKLLLLYDWPGNVTELEGCLQRATSLCSDSVVRPQDLPAYLHPSSQHAVSDSRKDSGEIIPLAEVEKNTILNALERLKGDKMATARLLGIGKTTLYRKLREYGFADRWITRQTNQ